MDKDTMLFFFIMVLVVAAPILYVLLNAFNKKRQSRKMENRMRWNEELANRFVSDYRLPISITSDPDIFIYQLMLYEDGWGSLTKWTDLLKLIDERYDGSAQAFLDDYYAIRDTIIKETESSEAFKAFNEGDMKRFEVKDQLNVTSNNIYNGSNDRKCFLSVDLRKANFQALKFADPAIVRGAENYEDFIGNFTDLDYIKTSKYTRQVVFGKLNPKRHITVEKFLINKVLDVLTGYPFPEGSFTAENVKESIVSLSNDEIVFEIKETFDIKILENVAQYVLRETGLEVRCEAFKLRGFQLRTVTGNARCRQTFYVKRFLDGRPQQFMCVPAPYHAIVYKLYNGLEINEYDRHFVYEKMDCRFCEDFDMVELNKAEK